MKSVLFAIAFALTGTAVCQASESALNSLESAVEPAALETAKIAAEQAVVAVENTDGDSGDASARAFASKSRVDCVINVEGRRNTVSFAVAKLGRPNAELLSLGATEEDPPILEGRNNKDIRAMNDQGGDLRADEKTLTLFGDGDGCTFIRIVLFKDSGYTRGWASESGSEVPHWYTTDVVCAVKSL